MRHEYGTEIEWARNCRYFIGCEERDMAIMKKIEYEQASPEARAVFDDIMATRKVDTVNDIWKVLANDPPTMRRNWENMKQAMAPGKLDSLTKEMIYIAVSINNNCDYCINSHTAAARKAGMSDAMLSELIAVVSVANAGNRLAIGYQVEVDDRFKPVL
jgi:AhpD family alkylhydroperoxidase